MSFDKNYNSEIIHHEDYSGESYDDVVVNDYDGRQICVLVGDDDDRIKKANLFAESPKMYRLLMRLKFFIQDSDFYDKSTMEQFVNEINEIDEKINRQLEIDEHRLS